MSMGINLSNEQLALKREHVCKQSHQEIQPSLYHQHISGIHRWDDSKQQSSYKPIFQRWFRAIKAPEVS